MSLVISFLIGVMSSVVAATLILSRGRFRYRLRFRAILHLIEGLAEAIRKSGYGFDHVVTIGRSSGVAGSILAGQFALAATVSVTTVKRRLPDGSRTIALDTVSEGSLSMLGGKRLLIFICCNDTGTSLRYVVDALLGLSQPPAEIRTAALYTSPSPVLMPQFTGVVLERESRQSMTKILTGLPWVTARWLQPFGAERSADRDQ